MAKRRKMSDEELVAHVYTLETQSAGTFTSVIQEEQKKALDYYNSRLMGNEVEGRSQLISSDVYDTVEGMLPLVLKPFVSSDDLVKFAPFGPEDEEAAQQETEYINYVVTQKNNIFENLLAWVKTGLLQKNGIIKYWWQKGGRTRIERYDDVDDDVFHTLIEDKSVQVVQHTEKQADYTNEETGAPAVLHDVVIRVTEDRGYATYAVIPPEEFRINRDATSIDPKNAYFVQHVTRKTITQLREMGYDVDDDISDDSTNDPRESSLYFSRNIDDAATGDRRYDTTDSSMREVMYRETYLLVDADGDGKAELRKVCLVGSTILHNEETEEIPFCAWSPVMNPFRFYGGCPADETISIQNAKTGLIRNTMDNIYTANNNRTYIGPKVNIDDFIDNQIGGYVRIGEGGIVGEQIQEAQVTPIAPLTIPMLELFNEMKENRTGVTRYNQGSDAGSLNKTATGIRIIAEASNERIGLVSRAFAELGMKPLMLGIHGLCRRHSTREETIRLRNKWVKVDPRSWKTRYDMSVSVGLGNSDRTMQMQAAQLLLQEQKDLAGITGPGGIVTPQNFYEAAAKLAQSVGEKNPERFFTAPPKPEVNPETGEPIRPQPPDPMDNPEVKFKLAEHKLREREVAIKESEFQLKADTQKYGEQSDHLNRLENHARLTHEMNATGKVGEANKEGAESPSPEVEEENNVISAITESQNNLVAAFTQFMQSMAESNRIIAMAMEESQRPKVVSIKKQADGQYIGVKEPIASSEEK